MSDLYFGSECVLYPREKGRGDATGVKVWNSSRVSEPIKEYQKPPIPSINPCIVVNGSTRVPVAKMKHSWKSSRRGRTGFTLVARLCVRHPYSVRVTEPLARNAGCLGGSGFFGRTTRQGKTIF